MKQTLFLAITLVLGNISYASGPSDCPMEWEFCADITPSLPNDGGPGLPLIGLLYKADLRDTAQSEIYLGEALKGKFFSNDRTELRLRTLVLNTETHKVQIAEGYRAAAAKTAPEPNKLQWTLKQVVGTVRNISIIDSNNNMVGEFKFADDIGYSISPVVTTYAVSCQTQGKSEDCVTCNAFAEIDRTPVTRFKFKIEKLNKNSKKRTVLLNSETVEISFGKDLTQVDACINKGGPDSFKEFSTLEQREQWVVTNYNSRE